MQELTSLTLKIKLLIYEYKERFPFLSPREISTLFCVNYNKVEILFMEKELIVPSKMNE